MTQDGPRKWSRMTGAQRTEFADACYRLYVQEKLSIREVATQTRRSYGAVHAMLRGAGVALRPRGNPGRRSR
jgi:hypothetical protein